MAKRQRPTATITTTDPLQASRDAIARQVEINANASGWGGVVPPEGEGAWASNYGTPVGSSARASGPTNVFGGSEDYMKWGKLPVAPGQPVASSNLRDPYKAGSSESAAWQQQVGVNAPGREREGVLRPDYAPTPAPNLAPNPPSDSSPNASFVAPGSLATPPSVAASSMQGLRAASGAGGGKFVGSKWTGAGPAPKRIGSRIVG